MSDEPGKTAGSSPPLSAQDALAFMQKMWNPFGMPMPGSTSGAVESTPASPQNAGASPAASPAMPNPMAVAMPGLLAFPNPAAMFAALDPAQVERKIAELRVIEGWLAMSLNLMQMSIKTLELQHASLEALQGATKREEKPRKE
jgi:hypothetical protein